MNMEPESGVVRSLDVRDATTAIPNTSFIEFLLSRLNAGMAEWCARPWVVDVATGKSVTFGEAEAQSKRVASALNRRGFRPGDILYFVTYEMAQLYVVQLAVWRLGGAVRGCFQREQADEYARQLHETHSRFVLVDAETAPNILEASDSLEWPVTLLSIGYVTVPGATSFNELLEDDGTDCPENVDVDPNEDIVVIPNTSGSTALPKGVLHTHRSTLAMLTAIENLLPSDSMMAATINHGVVNFLSATHALVTGSTMFHIGKFKQEEYFDLLMKYKPRHVMMYPFMALWFARCGTELARLREANFLESIWIGGWVLDHTTSQLIAKELPNTILTTMYGLSECAYVTVSIKGEHPSSENVETAEQQGQRYVSSGKLIPFLEGKVVDPATGKTLNIGEQGEIFVRSPCMMKGYLTEGEPPNRTAIDRDGWLRTGDFGYFDREENIFVKERISFIFKYKMTLVCPSDIESVLQEHPSVQGAGVVGIPHEEMNNLARAFVVLRPDCHATAAELQNHVAQRLPEHMRLHGGVRFVEKLPENRGGKLDRTALKVIAMAEEE